MLNLNFLDIFLTEMVETKSNQTQEEAALLIEKTVHDAVTQCMSLYESWEPENLCDSMQILDFDDNLFGHKLQFKLTPDYVCTSSKDAQEHYLQLLEQSSMDEEEKKLVLHDYTQKTMRNQNETIPPHFHLIEYSTNKLKDSLNRLEDTIYDRPPEDYKAYYESLLQKHENQVRKERISLKRWQCIKCRPMTINDYKEKTEGVKSALSELAPEMPLEYMLCNGADDTSNFGRYLICERKTWNEERLIKVIRLTVAWQWLLKEEERLQNTLKKNNPSVNSTKENAFKDLLHNHLNMKDNSNNVTFEGKTFRRDNVIIGLMHYSIDKRIIHSNNIPNFISLIAPIIRLTKTKTDSIRRTCNKTKEELSSYKCELKDLDWHHIKEAYPCAEEKEIYRLFRMWDGLYTAIDAAAQKSKLFKKLITN